MGKISWGREWQPAPLFLLGELHEQWSLMDYSPWSHKEPGLSDSACTHPIGQSNSCSKIQSQRTGEKQLCGRNSKFTWQSVETKRNKDNNSIHHKCLNNFYSLFHFFNDYLKPQISLLVIFHKIWHVVFLQCSVLLLMIYFCIKDFLPVCCICVYLYRYRFSNICFKYLLLLISNDAL